MLDEADADLVQRTRAGDLGAFDRLSARHKAWLFRFIRRYVGNDADALDVLQDTMLACWLALGRYDSERPFQAWLRQIGLNKCRDWSRRGVLRRVVGYFSTVPEAEAVPGNELQSNPETMSIADQLLARLDAAIAALPLNLREPLVLTVFEGLAQREVAELLSISEKAVETRIYRARQRLHRLFERSDLTMLVGGMLR